MIVAKRKNMDDIIDNIKDMKSVLVVGCNGCVGIHKMGGEKQAEELASLLKLSDAFKGTDFKADDTTVIRQCDPSIIKESLADVVGDYEAVLSMACGAGVQVIADAFADLPVFPAMDTTFIGIENRDEAMLYERCVACGNCVLDQTGGICPVTRCPKAHMNGPCGGVYNGKCETDKNRDCAWVLIYNRMKDKGLLDLHRKIKGAKDFSKRTHPRAQEV
jgi:hypothetical protein